MLAGWTNLRRFITLENIAAITAFPKQRFFSLEDAPLFNIFSKLQITRLMAFFPLPLHYGM